jgi:hypothetical protein
LFQAVPDRESEVVASVADGATIEEAERQLREPAR